MRRNGRAPGDLRELRIEAGASAYAEGSCLICTGDTRVLCTASVEEQVPEWRAGRGAGWVTAEYAMLPRSTHTRKERERRGPGGRTLEIQRLIGRALRSVVTLDALGERTVIIDCDVLQADGGTRTAAVTGGWVALALACDQLVRTGTLETSPLGEPVAAVSVGVRDGVPLLDLDYPEDRDAEVDMNVVATADGRIVEVQGTAEGDPFPRETLDRLVDLALRGIRTLTEAQLRALSST
jgi:ribonuclease PH